jgi:hypothetical protein
VLKWCQLHPELKFRPKLLGSILIVSSVREREPIEVYESGVNIGTASKGLKHGGINSGN